MDKLIAEHRKKIGDFEVVDIVDTAEIERLRAAVEVDVSLGLQWTWNYDSEFAELRSLYEKGKVNQWNAETDLDWSIPCTPDEFIVDPQMSLLANATRMMGKDEATQKAAAFDELSYLLSQLLHGEQAALQLCGQLTNACDKMDEKWYAASQVIDEARHVEVLSKFLQRKMGGIHPIAPTLKVLLDILLEADSVQKKTLGMQTLFEGTAVGIMDTLRDDSKNALLTDMLTRVAQDESRHAAFGVLMMRRIVGEASTEERNAMEDWAFQILETLNANQQLDMLHRLGPKYGVDADFMTRTMIDMEGWATVNARPFMHTVVPNLRKLGLITERTEAGWTEVGLMVESQPGVKGVPVVAA